ncbi:hypothetical protein [Umezawaea tangerina]|uniref:Polyketide cyclase/dehydrase/lipid transport protein n=1 Tax=Umezawaea tangerina TaxID=84725 RepID=A0A2T0SR17_9PSEU|nr:hypothetical protein [Umezawaea tangerina]PRY35850.1 hypothetical protein CLV43_113277 [Umezawaea tangerina]
MGERPRKLLFEVSGIIAAPPERVAPLLPEPVQGGWWYRGEHHALPHPEGTRYAYRVYNVAQRMRWGVPLANKLFIGYQEGMREGMRKGLERIGGKLGCATRLED